LDFDQTAGEARAVPAPAGLARLGHPVTIVPTTLRARIKMKYMMFVCVEESTELTPEESREIGPATEAWVAEMDGRGVRLQGNQLAPVTDATTVRVRGGEVVIADGPFTEAKEQIGGYDILECADLDEAIEVASKHPVARYGMLEVRPFVEW
jgi:hypothetical protein